MAEKGGAKKDQNKNKKGKQNEKKKHQENGIRHFNEQPVHATNQAAQKKKEKSNKHSSKPSSKKKSESFLKRLFLLLLITCCYVFFGLGFFYLVDYEKFVKIRDGAGLLFNKAVSLLPEEVVSKGTYVVEYVRPAAQVIVGKVSVFIGEISTFLSTNAVVKDHWLNIREITSICGERLVDYIRTLYLQITGFCHDAKSKLF